jgi:aldehyde decarbonylase
MIIIAVNSNVYSFHSLHHTQFRTNYSLFMPLYDHLYGTLDKSSDDLYERTLHGRGEEERPDVVHLTHLTTPASVFHLRLGFASLASAPSTASSGLGRAAAYPLAALASSLGRTFRCEASRLGKLNVETWVVPRYTSQVCSVIRFFLCSLFGVQITTTVYFLFLPWHVMCAVSVK